MRSSWPGIGLTTTSASPRARASEVVSPPGFPTSRSAAAISSCISEVNPITLIVTLPPPGTVATFSTRRRGPRYVRRLRLLEPDA